MGQNCQATNPSENLLSPFSTHSVVRLQRHPLRAAGRAAQLPLSIGRSSSTNTVWVLLVATTQPNSPPAATHTHTQRWSPSITSSRRRGKPRPTPHGAFLCRFALLPDPPAALFPPRRCVGGAGVAGSLRDSGTGGWGLRRANHLYPNYSHSFPRGQFVAARRRLACCCFAQAARARCRLCATTGTWLPDTLAALPVAPFVRAVRRSLVLFSARTPMGATATARLRAARCVLRAVPWVQPFLPA